MKLFPSRIRDLTFWHYQILGWLFFAILHCAIAVTLRGWDDRVILSTTLQVFAGFFVTSFLRLYYRRIRYQEISLFSFIAVIGLSSLGITIVWFGFYLIIQYGIFGFKVFDEILYPLRIMLALAYTFPDKLAWSGLYFGIKFWLDWLAEREHTEQATESAQRAQLQMLRYHLNPHFLFNALNSVRALIDEDTRIAKTMITELSEFLRYSLVSRNKPLVALREEIDALRLYLSIEQQRYEDKIQVTFDIDKRSEEISIPSFLIQPIVEQAIRCGMQSGSLPLKLEVQTGFFDGRLTIAVIHSGCKMQSNVLGGNGATDSGLVQSEARLHRLFPDRYRITTSDQDNESRVTLELRITSGAKHEEKAAGNPR